MCLFFRQNGEDSFLKEGENLIPQVFNSFLWIRSEQQIVLKLFLKKRVDLLFRDGLELAVE